MTTDVAFKFWKIERSKLTTKQETGRKLHRRKPRENKPSTSVYFSVLFLVVYFIFRFHCYLFTHISIYCKLEIVSEYWFQTLLFSYDSCGSKTTVISYRVFQSSIWGSCCYLKQNTLAVEYLNLEKGLKSKKTARLSSRNTLYD